MYIHGKTIMFLVSNTEDNDDMIKKYLSRVVKTEEERKSIDKLSMYEIKDAYLDYYSTSSENGTKTYTRRAFTKCTQFMVACVKIPEVHVKGKVEFETRIFDLCNDPENEVPALIDMINNKLKAHPLIVGSDDLQKNEYIILRTLCNQYGKQMPILFKQETFANKWDSYILHKEKSINICWSQQCYIPFLDLCATYCLDMQDAEHDISVKLKCLINIFFKTCQSSCLQKDEIDLILSNL